MPGYLFFFCAEWQRARKAVHLDAETLREVLFEVNEIGELPDNCSLAWQYQLEGWLLDVKEAAENGLLSPWEGTEGPRVYGPGPALLTSSALRCSNSPNTSIRFESNHSPSSPSKLRAASPARPQSSASGCSGRPGSSHGTEGRPGSSSGVPRLRSGTAPPSSCGRSTTRSMTEKFGPHKLLFRNSNHPLSDLSGSLSRDEFVTEIRRRLVAEQFFPWQPHQQDENCHAVLSVEDAEDLFEVLLLLQQSHSGRTGNSSLEMGRQLDTDVDAFFALHRFRQLMERGASSLETFFEYLDLDNSKYLLLCELRHFLKNADSDGLGDWDAPLVDVRRELLKIAEVLFIALDCNKDGQVELWEMQKMLSLTAPPRLSMVDLVSHFKMKNGFCRGALPVPMDRAQFYDHLNRVERLDLSPEDSMRFFRAIAGGHSSAVIQPLEFDQNLKYLPLEVTWGVETHAADQLYCAIGAHLLQQERRNRQDASMPPDALITSPELEDDSDRRYRFNNLWERCVAPLGKDAPEAAMAARRHLKESCCRRYTEAAENFARRFVEKQPKSTFAKGRISRPITLPRCLFPNIGDVISVSSTRLYAGQVCVVRYRLLGNCNFWTPLHQVLKDEQKVVSWPVKKADLGLTPFVGLVPRGLCWSPGGGGGFYLGREPYTRVDAALRADLPPDNVSGQAMQFGTVAIVAPSLVRTSRTQNTSEGLCEEFELRLFCSNKQKITGCIGEPLPVTVVHQVRPPPISSLQVQCTGPTAELRWSALDLGTQAKKVAIGEVRLSMTSENIERMICLEAGTTKLTLPDLPPNTDFDFHVRLENIAGPGWEAVAHCRTNSKCSAVSSLTAAVRGTTHVELTWQRPKVLGNETTKDRHQQHPEAVEFYQADLKIKEELSSTSRSRQASVQSTNSRRAMDKRKSQIGSTAEELGYDVAVPEQPEDGDDCNADDDDDDENGVQLDMKMQPTTRACQWAANALHQSAQNGSISVRVDGLRADTCYTIEGLCAVNSMGLGQKVKPLEFWTSPLVPMIASVRVKSHLVLVALSEAGGSHVKEYNVTVSLAGSKGQEATFCLTRDNLKAPFDGQGEFMELSLPFENMPAAAPYESHEVVVWAENPGESSGLSQAFDSIAISRQQGADAVEATLKMAIEARSIDNLVETLRHVRDIEFADDCYIVEGTELLAKLQVAKQRLDKAVEDRDPVSLEEALSYAVSAELPDLKDAQVVLRQLKLVWAQLEAAKGIDAISDAVEAVIAARLPAWMLAEARKKLGSREAAQLSLVEAVTAARIAPLVAALDAARDMHLPGEKDAEKKLEDLQQSMNLVQAALSSGIVLDLQFALMSAAETGLREDEVLDKALAKLNALQQGQEDALANLRVAMEACYPDQLEAGIQQARAAQTSEVHLQDAIALLQHLARLIEHIEQSAGDAERMLALEAGSQGGVPKPLLQAAERQLECLKFLHDALESGHVDVLRKALKDSDHAGVKASETNEARVVYNEWNLASRRVEVEVAVTRPDGLRAAVKEAAAVGINVDDLQQASAVVGKLERRDTAEQALKEAVEAKVCEDLQIALKAACDAELINPPLMYRATTLLGHLVLVRDELAKAIETAELRMLYQACMHAKELPALPDIECDDAERMLIHLQNVELKEFTNDLEQAMLLKNYRVIDHLALRAKRLAESGVETPDLSEAQMVAAAAAEDERVKLEKDLQQERAGREVLQPNRLINKVLPERQPLTAIPSATVVGNLEVYFGPSGNMLTTLPREIVEGTLAISYEEASDMAADISDSEVLIQKLLSAIRKLLAPEDEVVTLSEQVSDDHGSVRRRASTHNFIDGKLELAFAIYVRALHPGLSIAEALTERGPLGEDLFWDGEPNKVQLVETVTVQPPYEHSVDTVATHLASALIRHVVSPIRATFLTPGPRKRPPRRLTDFVRNVHVRELRRITVELSWSYPQFLMDTLDAACFVFDVEHLIDIIDHRGRHSTRRGPTSSEAVRHAGDVIDRSTRMGKQIMQIRLDLMPSNATDLLFVLSAYNSRNLCKFTGLRVVVYDSDTRRELCSGSVPDPGPNEAVLMCSLYRLPDRLWRMRMQGMPCKGTARDYKPVLNQILKVGYPRNKSMRLQVNPLMQRIQKEFMLDLPVKPTRITLGLGSAMTVSYAIELFGPEASGDSIVDHIAEPSFQQVLVEALQAVGGKRFGPTHLAVHPASWKVVQSLRYDLCWRYPRAVADKKFVSKEIIPPQEDNYLDATCMVFEAQALSDVVDYRGPHGVRIVHNGVLDYGGVWVGNVGIGDATGGAVLHLSEHMDNAERVGTHTMEVKLDNLPSKSTDLYFSLSASNNSDVSRYGGLHIRILDSENFGHELAYIELDHVDPAEAIIACCMSKDGKGGWAVSPVGCSTHGDCRSYRPMLQCLRMIQARKHERQPEWPHQVPLSLGLERTESQCLADLGSKSQRLVGKPVAPLGKPNPGYPRPRLGGQPQVCSNQNMAEVMQDTPHGAALVGVRSLKGRRSR